MAVSLSALHTGRALLRRNIFLLLVLISIRGRVDTRAIVRLEEFSKLKNPVTFEIEPATLQVVAYCLKELHDRLVENTVVENKIKRTFRLGIWYKGGEADQLG
jgi:hypothetical protein